MDLGSTEYLKTLFGIYQSELQRKIDIDKSFNVPIIILSGIGSIYFYLLTTYKRPEVEFFKCLEWWDYAFYLSLIGLFVFLIISVARLLLSYNRLTKGVDYTMIVNFEKINYDLREHTKANLSKSSGKRIFLYISNSLSSAIDKNIAANNYRMNQLFRAKRNMSMSFLFILISFVFYCIPIYLGLKT